MGRCQCSMDVTSVRFFLFHPLSPLLLFFKVEEAETERSPLKKRIKTKGGEKIDLNPERKSHACSIWGLLRGRESLRAGFHKPNSHNTSACICMYIGCSIMAGANR